MGRRLALSSFAIILGLLAAAAAMGAPSVKAAPTTPMIWIPDQVIEENTRLTLTVVAADRSAAPSAFVYSMRLGDPPAEGATLNSSTGVFSWTPGESQGPGVYPVTICATRKADPERVTGCGTFTVTVLEVDEPPVAHMGGPYSGVVRVPIVFDGSASKDPDGDPLSFAWDFGDGDMSSSMVSTHTYRTTGIFNVKLRVGEPLGLHGDDAAAVIVDPFYSARVFFAGASRTIRVGSGEPTPCVQMEPAGSYTIGNVDLSSIRIQCDGRSIPADMGGSGIGADVDQNGIQEITACFPKDGMRSLFAGKPAGDYVGMIEGTLTSGGSFRGAVKLHVAASGSPDELAAAILPNPLRLETSLRFRTSRTGGLSVALYDLQGRLVRTFLRDPSATAGDHDLRIEARDPWGNRLPSGIYYVRIQSSVNGVKTMTITVTN